MTVCRKADGINIIADRNRDKLSGGFIPVTLVSWSPSSEAWAESSGPFAVVVTRRVGFRR